MWSETTKPFSVSLEKSGPGLGKAVQKLVQQLVPRQFSLHGVPDDLAGGEGDESVPAAHVTPFFPHDINNY